MLDEELSPSECDFVNPTRMGLREIPDFPIQGILFKDVAPLLARPGVLSAAVSAIETDLAALDFQLILAIDARGFILGAAIADRLNCGLVMVRKPGKLPGVVESFDYSCEYCSGTLEVTSGIVSDGMRCLIVDDLIATGGTARATADFVKSRGGTVCGYAFMMEINVLKGRELLQDAPVFSVMNC